MSQCVVCQRISPKTVFQTVHQILNDKEIDKQTIHKIASDMVTCINYADHKNRIFFCGKAQKVILAGLLYLVGFKYGKQITMRFIVAKLDWSISEVSVGISHRRWLATFPELFPHMTTSNIEQSITVSYSVNPTIPNRMKPKLGNKQ